MTPFSFWSISQPSPWRLSVWLKSTKFWSYQPLAL
jgi:hypothetical protein